MTGICRRAYHAERKLAALQKRIDDAPEVRLLPTGEASSVHAVNDHCEGQCLRVRLVPVEEP